MLKNVTNLGQSAPMGDNLSQVLAMLNQDARQKSRLSSGRVVLTATVAQEAIAVCPAIIIVQSGALSLTVGGQTITLSSGEFGTLPAGAFTIETPGADLVLTSLGKDQPELSLEKLDADQSLTEGGSPNARLLTTPMPETARHEYYDKDLLSWGLWTATPYHRTPITYGFSELMYLRKGEVTLANDEEGQMSFHAGDIFIVEEGAVASWSNSEFVSKFWLIRSRG